MPSETGSLGQTRRPNDWRSLIADHLLPRRHDERVWTVGAGTVAAFEAHRKRWKTQARRFESASTSAALVKADVHLARIALVLAEAQAPGRGGEVPVGVIERAAEIVDFTLNCWRALPEQGGLALSRRDQQLDASIGRLVAWLDERGGKASRRDIQRACVAGVRTATDLDALLRRYEDMFPGTVSTEDQEGGRGLPTVVVAAPARRPVPKVSANPDTLVTTNEIPHCDAENGAVGTADTLSPDTLIADTLNRTVSRGCAAHPDGPRKGCRYCIRCQA